VTYTDVSAAVSALVMQPEKFPEGVNVEKYDGTGNGVGIHGIVSSSETFRADNNFRAKL